MEGDEPIDQISRIMGDLKQQVSPGNSSTWVAPVVGSSSTYVGGGWWWRSVVAVGGGGRWWWSERWGLLRLLVPLSGDRHGV